MNKSPQSRLLITKQVSLSFFIFLVLACGACTKLQDMAVEHALRKIPTGENLKNLSTVQVFLCGTGSPQPNTKSSQACTLIAAGGKVFLFDAGENAMRAIEESGVPLSVISRIFITHWHSDHFSGLGGVINNSWVDGRKEPLTVYGPEGVEEVIQGLRMAYQLDARYRTAHYVQNPELAFAQARTVKMPPKATSVPLYDGGGVHIEAVRVDHYPVEPAFGYVLTYKNKKIFISGDTKVTDLYYPAMKDSDLVIHEAINGGLIKRAAAALRRMNRNTEADHMEKILEYHADTLELAKFAQRAGVKHLVLTHLIPEPGNFLTRRLFIKGMGDFYSGKLTVGYDAMVIELKV